MESSKTNRPISLLLHEGAIDHVTGYAHPESPKRIRALSELMKMDSLADIGRPPLELHRNIDPTIVHHPDYVHALEDVCLSARDLRSLDEDTYVCRDSWRVACEGLSLQEQAINLIFSSGCPSFVMSRPPGHHALADRAMGFCMFANAAYAARYAQRVWGVERVAIIDWDVHHGNGTEAIFLNDPSVYAISIHAHPFWPLGFGHPEQRGEGKGVGCNLNIPVPFEAGDTQYRQVFERFVIPELLGFRPDLIIVAAGFDAHYSERFSSLGEKSFMALSDAGFKMMTALLDGLARELCGGRLHFTLEGGYYLPSLTSGVRSVIETLRGSATHQSSELSEGKDMDNRVWEDFVTRTAAAIASKH